LELSEQPASVLSSSKKLDAQGIAIHIGIFLISKRCRELSKNNLNNWSRNGML